MIGFFQPGISGSMPSARIGSRKTVPSKMARSVPFGLLYIDFKLYSFTRAAFGVIVAHLTPTPYFSIACAASIVT